MSTKRLFWVITHGVSTSTDNHVNRSSYMIIEEVWLVGLECVWCKSERSL